MRDQVHTQEELSSTNKTGPLSRTEFEGMEKQLLHQGRFANATLWKVQTPDGRTWVVKDFSSRFFLVRYLIGVPLIRHEFQTLRKLAGIEGVPDPAFQMDRFALLEPFYTGESLRFLDDTPPLASYFHALEKTIMDIHERGVYHLDLRNSRNILITTENKPILIDWQSAIRFSRLPSFIRNLLSRIDLSGIYKHWSKYRPETLNKERIHLLFWQLGIRKFWRLRAYSNFFSFKTRPLNDWEENFIRSHSPTPENPSKITDKKT